MKITDLGDGRYLGRCSTLPGLNVEADSVEEVLRLAPKVARALIEAMRDKGVPLPRSLDSAAPPMSIHLLVAA
jgi:predicted RNase H-like HicB family nuclease